LHQLTQRCEDFRDGTIVLADFAFELEEAPFARPRQL